MKRVLFYGVLLNDAEFYAGQVPAVLRTQRERTRPCRGGQKTFGRIFMTGGITVQFCFLALRPEVRIFLSWTDVKPKSKREKSTGPEGNVRSPEGRIGSAVQSGSRSPAVSQRRPLPLGGQAGKQNSPRAEACREGVPPSEPFEAHMASVFCCEWL